MTGMSAGALLDLSRAEMTGEPSPAPNSTMLRGQSGLGGGAWGEAGAGKGRRQGQEVAFSVIHCQYCRAVPEIMFVLHSLQAAGSAWGVLEACCAALGVH
jgi:hypothetical protein